MRVMDSAHRVLIEQCHNDGHKWSEWEDTKFISGSERKCSHCQLFVAIDKRGTTKSYAIGSMWESASVATSFINSLAFKSSVLINKE